MRVIADLGRPTRFLNMLRVFKLQSPMSLGAWILVAFSGCAFLSLASHELILYGFTTPLFVVTRWLGEFSGAITGFLLAGYTGEDYNRTLPTFDLLDDLYQRFGFRVGLGHLALETLGYSKSADGLRERRGEQAEFGERLPLFAADPLFTRDDLASRVEVILAAQQALDAGSQQFLFFRELDIHPIPRAMGYRPKTAFAMMLRWISFDPP